VKPSQRQQEMQSWPPLDVQRSHMRLALAVFGAAAIAPTVKAAATRNSFNRFMFELLF
jgi:hypothetical protein